MYKLYEKNYRKLHARASLVANANAMFHGFPCLQSINGVFRSRERAGPRYEESGPIIISQANSFRLISKMMKKTQHEGSTKGKFIF